MKTYVSALARLCLCAFNVRMGTLLRAVFQGGLDALAQCTAATSCTAAGPLVLWHY